MIADGFIGMFDSGLGGLSVLRDVRAALPSEDILYYADSAYCPYGERDDAEIIARSALITGALIERGAKIVIVACNTATSVALMTLRASTTVPIIGLVPAVKPAVATSPGGRVGVLATPRTVEGRMLADLIAEHRGETHVMTVPAPGLADLVESGHVSGLLVDGLLRPLLAPLTEARIDTLVLGCTHYPFLRVTLGTHLGRGVRITDSGEAIARRAASVLAEMGAGRPRDAPAGSTRLLTSGDPDHVGTVAARLLGQALAVERLAL
ncbi:MAG: glutamate racemase [Thermomicrobiales bacterium]